MTQPLKNKMFISTRPEGMSDELGRLLNEKGATVLEFPLIEIKAAPLSNDEKMLFTRLEEFQWLILTSSNGVYYFFETLKELTGNQKLPENLQTAVIGEKTGKTLEKFGYRVAFVNPGSTAEDFTERFVRLIKTSHTKPKIFLPLGNLARTVIQDHLKEIADCTRVNIYQTQFPAKVNKTLSKRIENGRFDMLIFTSPSGVQNFLKLFPKLKNENIRMACIGGITANAAREKGFFPLAVAENSSSAGIAESILNYYISKT